MWLQGSPVFFLSDVVPLWSFVAAYLLTVARIALVPLVEDALLLTWFVESLVLAVTPAHSPTRRRTAIAVDPLQTCCRPLFACPDGPWRRCVRQLQALE